MFAMRTEPDDVQRMPEQRLWTAVLAKTVEEWVSGPLRSRKEAEAFLFEDEMDFRAVCHAAGLDPARMRSKLRQLRNPGGASAQREDSKQLEKRDKGAAQ